MGYNEYIAGTVTGDTCVKDMEITWTKTGRDYLIGRVPNRVKGLTISYFGLSDSDMNYLVTNKNIKKFVPSTSGVADECINGTNVTESKWRIFKERVPNVTDVTINFRILTSVWYNNSIQNRGYNNYLNTFYTDSGVLSNTTLTYEPKINNDSIFVNLLPYNFFANLRNDLGLGFLNTTNTITPTLQTTLDNAVITLKSIILSFINNIKPQYKEYLSNHTRFYTPIDTKDISTTTNNIVNVGFTYNKDSNDIVFDDLDILYRYKILMLFFISNYLVTELSFTDVLGENTVSDNVSEINAYTSLFRSTLTTNLRERPEPDTVNEINSGGFFIPGCFDLNCSDFWGIFASDMDVDIETIADCVIADFDGWVQT